MAINAGKQVLLTPEVSANASETWARRLGSSATPHTRLRMPSVILFVVRRFSFPGMRHCAWWSLGTGQARARARVCRSSGWYLRLTDGLSLNVGLLQPVKGGDWLG